MKKFLPVIIFVMAFTAVIAGQVAFNLLSVPAQAKDNNYALYEKVYLAGKFQSIDGKTFEVSKIKSPVVIYNFWASWCNPCLEEIPSMQAMKKKFTDDQVMVFAFNTDVENQMPNTAIPVTIIYAHGKVVHFSNGPMDFNSEEMIANFKKWSK